MSTVVGEGRVVECEGSVVRRGKRMAFCESVARCEGKVVARGMLTKMVLPSPIAAMKEKGGEISRL